MGKITNVKGTQVSVMYSVRDANPYAYSQRSARDVSILYSEGEHKKTLIRHERLGDGNHENCIDCYLYINLISPM